MTDFLQRWVDASPRNRRLYEAAKASANKREAAIDEAESLAQKLAWVMRHIETEDGTFTFPDGDTWLCRKVGDGDE